MNTPTTDTIIELITFYSVQVIAALIILFFGRWLAQHLARLLGRMMERHKVDPTLVHFTEPLSYYTLLVMVVIAAAGQIGINTTSFLTIVGAAGLAIALALKDSLSNFSAGIMLVLFRPFKVGDIVTVAGGVTAQVQQITLFSTNLCTADNQLVIVPNNKIVSDTITNINAKDTRRIDLTVKLRSSANIAKAKQILDQLLIEDSRILKDPAPLIAVSDIGENTITMVVRPWVKSEMYWDVRFELTEKIKTSFDTTCIWMNSLPQDGPLVKEDPAIA
ncbi:MAG: mechanosensitive ion channel protein MscS [Deltaproteobacteria bacterium RIFOXYD12_FULL_50_9]|nr:MAG: mechanosensitive ion channel protein MscS [Deltaproteobacteria bacterium RIFOXYD12_FULL_50_9]